MMNDEKCMLVVWALSCAFAFLVGCLAGKADATSTMQNQAVELGHARYVVKNGEFKFEWNKSGEEEN